jgi:acyl-CoA thioester hydrolase
VTDVIVIERAADERRLSVPVALRWGDLDALGHVNNATMLRLLEEARLRAFWRGNTGDDAPTAVFEMDVLSGGGSRATLIARQEIEYYRPVPYSRRPLDVQMWIGRIGGSSADVCFEVFAHDDDGPPTPSVRATAVVVVVDTASGRPMRWSANERAAWEPYVGQPIVYRRSSSG